MCLVHDTSVRQHYKSEHWAPCRNQTPSWLDWKIVESDSKPEQTTTTRTSVAYFGDDFATKLYGIMERNMNCLSAEIYQSGSEAEERLLPPQYHQLPPNQQRNIIRPKPLKIPVDAQTHTRERKWLFILLETWQMSDENWASWRENLSSGFATSVDSNLPGQPQKLYRGLKFQI